VSEAEIVDLRAVHPEIPQRLTDRASEPDKPTVTVVIPTLNEATNLPYVLEHLPPEVTEVVVVDGHSTDCTIEVAKVCWPGVKVVLQDGKGKGNALGCGFREATGDIIVMMDADGSNDPGEIPRFVFALTSGFGFAKGTRFVTGGGSADISLLRRVGNKCLVTLVNLLFRARYTDLCYGYNAFWANSLPALYPDCDGFEVETLMNIRAAESDLRVIEVPSFEHRRRHGTSNLRVLRDGLRVLRTIGLRWSARLAPAH
jgi:glycosyltransferase involved in cell wall biosynthesis